MRLASTMVKYTEGYLSSNLFLNTQYYGYVGTRPTLTWMDKPILHLIYDMESCSHYANFLRSEIFSIVKKL